MDVLPDEIAIVDAELRTVKRLQRMKGNAAYGEADFDRLIASHADMIGSALTNAGLVERGCSLRVLAQQKQVANIDVLLAEVEGDELRRLVLVETKLFRNPESHRTALAQILEYANTLQFDVDVDEILAKVDEPTHAWLMDHRDQLQRLKSRGDFLLLVCGDRIQPRLVEMAKPMLDRRTHVLSGIELALVSLALYEAGGTKILVPNLVGAVTRGQRDLCIEVTVRTDRGAKVPATVDVIARDDGDARATPTRAKRWTKEAFLADAAQCVVTYPEDGPSWDAELRDLIEFVENTTALSIKWGGGVSGTFSIVVDTGRSSTKLAWFGSDATVSLHRSHFAPVLGDTRATAKLVELGKLLDIPIKASGHTPTLGTNEDDSYFDVREPEEMRIFKQWLVEMRDEIVAAEDARASGTGQSSTSL